MRLGAIFVYQKDIMMRKELNKLGFEIIEHVYSAREINTIISVIENQYLENKFGIREFLLNQPILHEIIFNEKLIQVIKSISSSCNKIIKSVYFDKPPSANWIVNWHQELTINLVERKEINGYKNWRVTKNRVIVRSPREFLEKIFTIRIHLDDCMEENGALRIIEGSHKEGVIEIKDWMKDKKGTEKVCEVKAGGIIIMKPLILHSSRRTENMKNRRVIHVEFTDEELPNVLSWKEMMKINKTACA